MMSVIYAPGMRVAAVQAASAWLDRAATIEIVCTKMQEAAAGGADLVAFPETFLAGYPIWADLTAASAWEDADQQAAYAWYLDQSVEVESTEFRTVVEASQDLGVFTYVGIVERSASGGSVYCSLVAIDPELGVVGVHRKLKPTFGERLIWADGDGQGLRTHRFRGATLSGLNCWENWMPLARAAMYAGGTQIHIATWPGSVELTRDITRFVALEGRVFVVSVGAVLGAEDIPDDFPLREQLLAAGPRFCNGGTAIAAPDGSWVAEPLHHEETIVFAELDLSLVRAQRQNFDPAGHYSRPDVLDLQIHRSRPS